MAAAGTPDAVEGLWISEKGTVFSVAVDGDSLTAHVLGMRKPRPDRKNPEPALRNRPVVGLQVLSEYRLRGSTWRGRIYDPGSGRSYASRITVDDEGNLRVRGYIGFALLGKTEVFQPVSRCSEDIVTGLRAAGLAELC